MAYYDTLATPVGTLFVGGSAEGIHRVEFLDGDGHSVRDLAWSVARLEQDAGEPAEHDPALAAEAIRQLREYFAGERTEFSLPLAPRGTAFQQRVWRALRELPPGTTTSYAELARRIGVPSATRAVAGACAANVLAVAIPCHRVVRTDGALSGYRWGVERKRRLLEREAAAPVVAPASGRRSRH